MTPLTLLSSIHPPLRCSLRSWLAMGMWGGAACGAWAQSTIQLPTMRVVAPELEYRQFDSVALTGSSILSTRSKASLPVLVYERKDLDRIPAQSTAQLVQALTSQINGFHLGQVASSVVQSGPEAAAIHGFQDGTLVLLNGRRLPNFSRPVLGVDRDAIDLDVVPLQAIERIEVMNDGASARYGSDAVAGVINLITEAHVEGVRLGVQVNAPTAGSAGGQRAYVSVGQGDFRRDGWDWQLHASISQTRGLRTTDRESTQSVPSVGDPAEGVYYAANYFDLSRYAWPATVSPTGNVWGTVTQGSLAPQAAMVEGQCLSGFVPVLFNGEVGCWRKKSHGLSITPDQHRKQLLGSARYSLNAHWAAFAELAWSQKSLVADAVSADVAKWSQRLADGSVAYVAPYPLGPIRQAYAYDQYRLTLGVKGDWRGWDTQLAYTVGAQAGEFREAGVRSRTSDTPAFAQLGLTAQDLSTPADALSSDTLAKLAQGVNFSGVPRDRGKSTAQSLDAMASRVVTQTDAGDVALGVGASWRREGLRTDTFDQTATVAYTPADPDSNPSLRASRDVTAAFGQLDLPLTPLLNVDAQVRHDVYSDVGQVTTGKLALRWRPNKRWLLRGSAGTGFRAPDLTQVSAQSAYLGTTTTQVYDKFLDQSFYRRYYNEGNPDLKPETSLQYTLGARFDPSPRWSLGGDFWRVHIRDQIFVPSAQFTHDYREWYDRLISPIDDTTQRFAYRPYNLGEAWREGVDYELQYRYPSALGRWRVVWKGSHYLRAESQQISGEPKVSTLGVADGAGFEYVPKDKFSLMLALERPTWAGWLQVNYLSGNRENYNVWRAGDGQKGVDPVKLSRLVPAYTTVDVGWRWEPDAYHLVDLRVINLLDQYPPFRALGYPISRPGVDLRYGDYTGRTLQVRYEYKF